MSPHLTNHILCRLFGSHRVNKYLNRFSQNRTKREAGQECGCPPDTPDMRQHTQHPSVYIPTLTCVQQMAYQ
ncbi:unnamed protein product [Oppiella nova]|uniref:Uncharacterized protein n=1 Tax=Oppiella nova TaxID=334625 RepID=A0A7R9M0R7_9ACAR|nr:unnamed protein product [Oppiella nova]CAG2168778.1 unnamed protein product [Oppiella nova]